MEDGEIVFFSSRRRHTRLQGDWSSDVCSSDLARVDLIAECTYYGLPQLDGIGGNPKLTVSALGNQVDPSGGWELETALDVRSEERRVGKEGRSRWSPYH